MSDVGALGELAKFVGKSSLASGNSVTRDTTLAGIVRSYTPNPRKSGDLLGVVMALSARTRRMLQPRVDIDMDVFTPTGSRAIRMWLPETE